jgi:hypothetical protein
MVWYHYGALSTVCMKSVFDVSEDLFSGRRKMVSILCGPLDGSLVNTSFLCGPSCCEEP